MNYGAVRVTPFSTGSLSLILSLLLFYSHPPCHFASFDLGNSLTSILPLLHPECQSLPEPNLLPGQLSHGAVGMQGGRVQWISMAFESVSLSWLMEYPLLKIAS